jgi:hypothetical protein
MFGESVDPNAQLKIFERDLVLPKLLKKLNLGGGDRPMPDCSSLGLPFFVNKGQQGEDASAFDRFGQISLLFGG